MRKVSYQVPRKSLAFILIAVTIGVILYNFAPGDVEPGYYTATLDISSTGINVRHTLNQTLVLDGVTEDAEIELVGTLTNVTVEYQSVALISTSSSLVYKISAVGSPINAEHILLTLNNEEGFNVSLRPGLMTGQTF